MSLTEIAVSTPVELLSTPAEVVGSGEEVEARLEYVRRSFAGEVYLRTVRALSRDEIHRLRRRLLMAEGYREQAAESQRVCEDALAAQAEILDHREE